MEEILNLLGLDMNGVQTNSREYVIDLDEDNWGNVYSALVEQDVLYEETSESQLTDENAHVVYSNDDWNVTLNCQFNEDIYKLIIRKL